MCLGESVKLSGLYVYESYADFEYVNWQKESDPNFSAYGEFLTDSPTRTTRYGITRKPLVGSTSIVYITVQVVNC